MAPILDPFLSPLINLISSHLFLPFPKRLERSEFVQHAMSFENNCPRQVFKLLDTLRMVFVQSLLGFIHDDVTLSLFLWQSPSVCTEQPAK